MGHIRHQHKNINPKKQIESSITLAEYINVSPSQEPSNPCINTIYASMISTSDLLRTHSDKTGQLPLQSYRGHNFVFILYN